MSIVIINGLIIYPVDLGKKLEIRLACKTLETTKTLLTHLYDKNDKVVPVKLTVKIG